MHEFSYVNFLSFFDCSKPFPAPFPFFEFTFWLLFVFQLEVNETWGVDTAFSLQAKN